VSEGAFDAVVLGGGAAGMTAALVAALGGARVCLLEKDARLGGTTAWSGGMVWAPGTAVARTSGFGGDGPEQVRAYLEQLVPGCGDDPRMEAFLDAAPVALDLLAERTRVKLRPVPVYPDYYPDLPGAADAGRVLEPEPFDASVLGTRLALLRLPLPEFCLFGDMMVARQDLPHFRNVYRSVRSLGVVSRLLARHALEKVRYGRGTSLVLGNALVARFLASLLDAGVEVRTGVETRALVRDAGGTVSGVELAGGQVLGAARGVVLATGGFSHDRARRRAHLPAALADHSATAPGATGDGARLAEAVGAGFTDCAEGNAFWTPVSRHTRADGSIATYAHTVADRAKPGLVAVDARGRRFVNEAVSYHEFVRTLLANCNESGDAQAGAWLVCDARFLWKYGLGAVKPMSLRRRFFIRRGYLVEAPTIAALGRRLGLPDGALEATLETYNTGARAGEDPAFARGADAYQRFLGDSAVSPNPCVAPIERAPFYAVHVVPGDLGAAAGLATDASARVLGADDRPIPGLYACGADMRSVMEGAYPGPGITLGPAIAFGYLAACDLLRR
jgi:succinate dehydrogenase/fumarate reductase flavoprotein subunit